MNYNFKSQNRSKSNSYKWEDRESKDNLDDNFPLSVADADFLLAPEIKNGLIEYLRNVVLGYNKPSDNYYKSIIDWMKNNHNWYIDKEDIVITPGVINALYNSIESFTNVGDGVIIMTPVYPRFKQSILDTKRKVVTTSLIIENNKYQINFADLELKAKDSNNKMLILCNPHNPIGRVWTKEELIKINDICLKNNILVVSDEIHHDLILKGYTHTVFARINENSIILTAPSKSFNIAGLQVGNAIIKNQELREKFIKNMDIHGIHMNNGLSLIACELAYSKSKNWLNEFIKVIENNKKILKEYLQENIKEVKLYELEGTYLVWLDFKDLNLSHEELNIFLKENAKLFMSDGLSFGEEGINHQRMNIAISEDVLLDSLERLKKAINKKTISK